MSIPLKLYRCLGHGRKIFILFGFFVTFLQYELSHLCVKNEKTQGILCIKLFMIAHIFKDKHKVVLA